MTDIEVTSTQVVKLEDGDILNVTVPEDTPYRLLRKFQDVLAGEVRRKVGDNVIVLVSPGKVEVDIAKRNELSDIYQRLGELETQLDQLKFDNGQ